MSMLEQYLRLIDKAQTLESQGKLAEAQSAYNMSDELWKLLTDEQKDKINGEAGIA